MYFLLGLLTLCEPGSAQSSDWLFINAIASQSNFDNILGSNPQNKIPRDGVFFVYK